MSTRLIAILLGLTLLFCWNGTAVADVPTVRVEMRSVPIVHVAEAGIEAVHQVMLAARAPGHVLELPLDVGDLVADGALVARLDAREAGQMVAGAQAAVAEASAALEHARAEYRRAQSLAGRGFLSDSAVDQAKVAQDAAQARLRAAQAGRGQAGVVFDHARVVAPLTGVVSARHVEVGEFVQPGTPLVTVFDPGSMRAVVDLPSARMRMLPDGVEPNLRAWIEIPETGRSFEAVQVTVLPAADERTHTRRLRLQLPPEITGVVPGAFARAHIQLGESARVTIPAEAVVRRSELTGVYVVDARHGFSLRQIRVGAVLPDASVEVLAGLREGEEVALDPVRAGIITRAARTVR